jgi:hypothetical protein
LTATISSFLTHDGGRPLTCGIIADHRREDVDPRTMDLRELALLAGRNADACAYGKVVVIGRHGVFTFQATPDGATAPVFCGNSTAAALGSLGAVGSIRTQVHGAAGQPYEVSARVDGGAIAQTWKVPAATPDERAWRGCRVLFLPALNDYALVFGDLPAGTSPEDARRELLGGDPACKLAIVGGGAGDATVTFYNSNGRHGGAPQTGLATIALATRSVPWLADFFPDGVVTYPAAGGPRQAALPATAPAGHGTIAVDMPTVAVDLAPLGMERVA